ncbi:hypothetical protein B0T18DRAFT_318859 [Schizothecium vesticola]|uniref:Cell surface protein n=1 Tax=Schizothecium vesticola TaxID=314040 RepID=A0AA40F5E6_9PEZI|nr:hypothetical protein B0T18DRAFT_318859 [Schizothecium vesticola]
MHTTHSLLLATLLAAHHASAHGVVTMIRGANGVDMPGLSVADGTPRDCSSNRCGSQADTAIIRDREIRAGTVGPLGRTQGNGPIDAATMVANFMGSGAAPSNNGANSSVGVEDNIPASGAGNNNNNNNNRPATEVNVAATRGEGAASGLPTCGDDGSIEMVFHQDGAGPLTASVDATSGGTEESAFQTAEVTQDVPGFGIQGLSLATSQDFPLTVQMPAGMTCEGTVGGVQNVCVVRVRNGAAAGPFGGSAAFTQSPAARRRAVAYRLKRRALGVKA